MTAYYTIKECFSTCKNDDIPFIANVYNIGNHRKTKRELLELRFPIPPDVACSDEWQIKKATPKVLNALEYLNEDGNFRLFCWCAPRRCHAETIKAYLEE